jgi:microcystin-dependent protein
VVAAEAGWVAWEVLVGLETGTFISDLVATNPPSGDQMAQGDDHIRLIKQVLRNTFPTATRALNFPIVSAPQTSNFSVLSSADNTTFMVDTTGGTITAMLPSLVSTDAGWNCFFIKTNNGPSAIIIKPPSGSILSGGLALSNGTRRSIPNVRSRVFWTGSNWVAERVVGVPVGSIIPFSGLLLPVGFEWPNGQTLGSALLYPDYYVGVSASGLTHDLRGRGDVGKDDMGGTAAGRVTAGGSGVDGLTLGAAGGAETITLDISKIPSHAHGGGTGTDTPDHVHSYNQAITSGNQKPSSGGTAPFDTSTPVNTGGASARHTHSITAEGGGQPHNNMSPSIVLNKLLVVE